MSASGKMALPSSLVASFDKASRDKYVKLIESKVKFFSITQTDDPIPRVNFAFSVYYVIGAVAALMYALMDPSCVEITTYLVSAPVSRCGEMLAAFTCHTADYDSVAGTGVAETFNARTCPSESNLQTVGNSGAFNVSRCVDFTEATFPCTTADYNANLGTGHRQIFTALTCPRDGAGTGPRYDAHNASMCRSFSESTFNCQTADFDASANTGTRKQFTPGTCPEDGRGTATVVGAHAAAFCSSFAEATFNCRDASGGNAKEFHRIETSETGSLTYDRQMGFVCPGAVAAFEAEIDGWIDEDIAGTVPGRRYQGTVRITSAAASQQTVTLTNPQRNSIIGSADEMWAYWKVEVDDNVDLDSIKFTYSSPLTGEELRVHAPGHIIEQQGFSAVSYNTLTGDGMHYFDHKVSAYLPEAETTAGTPMTLLFRSRVMTVWYRITRRNIGTLPFGSFTFNYEPHSGQFTNLTKTTTEYGAGQCDATRNVPITYDTCEGTADVPVVFDRCQGTVEQEVEYAFCDGFVNICPSTAMSVRFSQAMAYATTWMSALGFAYNMLGQQELARRKKDEDDDDDTQDDDDNDDDAKDDTQDDDKDDTKDDDGATNEDCVRVTVSVGKRPIAPV